MYIQDGTGNGYQAKVDSQNRVLAKSVSVLQSEDASSDGRSYNINTGTINLTTAGESGVLYIKNTGLNDIKITSVGFLLGNSTGGTGDLELKIYKNTTTGTLVSGASAVSINQNKNFGSSKTLSATTYKGAEGSTITNGTLTYSSLLAGAARTYVIATGDVDLTSGASMAVSITPQTSNTSMDVQVFAGAIEELND